MKPPRIEAGDALFLDLDGTLVEIAPTPEAVRPSAMLPPLLARLSRRLDAALAVVSGRTIAEIDRILESVLDIARARYA